MIFNRKSSNTHTYRSLMRAATDSINKYYISKRFSGDGRQLGSGVAPITGHLPRTDSLFALNFLQAGKAPMRVSFLFFLSCFFFLVAVAVCCLLLLLLLLLYFIFIKITVFIPEQMRNSFRFVRFDLL